MSFYYAQALSALKPNAQFGTRGDTYAGIEWYESNSDSCPTESELDAKVAEIKAAEPVNLLRVERNKLLAETDWMANSDVTMSDTWKTYRQQLRDLPSTQSPTIVDGYLSNVTWPTKPS
jgi:hypothetical protein|tara:strand:- start:42 stop:398 length:357 start_codon:yes stop_codon:yes gene_type:complete